MIAHTVNITLRLMSERMGLVKHFSRAMARGPFVPLHDRRQVLTDAAVMLVDGGEAIADINVLRYQDPAARARTAARSCRAPSPE